MIYCFTFLSPRLTSTEQIQCFNYLLRAQKSSWYNPLSTCLQKISLNVPKIPQKKDFCPVQAGCPLLEIKYFPQAFLFPKEERIKKQRRKREKKAGKVMDIATTTRIKRAVKKSSATKSDYLVYWDHSWKPMQYIKKSEVKQNRKNKTNCFWREWE